MITSKLVLFNGTLTQILAISREVDNAYLVEGELLDSGAKRVVYLTVLLEGVHYMVHEGDSLEFIGNRAIALIRGGL